MGRRGPPPTPTALLRLRGSPRANRRKKEVAGPAGLPAPPEWLIGAAKQVWDSLIPQLDAMRVLTRIDGLTLARYCEAYVQWTDATAWIRTHGLTYAIKDDAGNVKCLQQWPQVGIANKLSATLLRVEQEFGLTPSARTRIHLERPFHNPDSSSKAAKFFSGA